MSTSQGQDVAWEAGLQELLVTTLGSDIGLDADGFVKIYTPVAPQDVEFPHIVHAPIDAEHVESFDGGAGLAFEAVQVDVYDLDYANVRTLGRRIREALQGRKGTYGALVVQGIRLLSESTDTEGPLPGSGEHIHRVRMDFWIAHKETIPDAVR